MTQHLKSMHTIIVFDGFFFISPAIEYSVSLSLQSIGFYFCLLSSFSNSPIFSYLFLNIFIAYAPKSTLPLAAIISCPESFRRCNANKVTFANIVHDAFNSSIYFVRRSERNHVLLFSFFPFEMCALYFFV